MKGEIFRALVEMARSGEPAALGIISSVKGSSPQKLGAKAIFYPDGRIEGTLGGGCLEAEIQQRALRALKTGQPATFDLLLDHDFGWDDGLICGGKVEGLILPHVQKLGSDFWTPMLERSHAVDWGVTNEFAIVQQSESDPAAQFLYQETVSPPSTFWIAGAGRIAQAVAPLALQLDFQVTVFDDRPALVNHRFFPQGVGLKADVWERILSEPLPHNPAFGLIVTRGHRHDALVLKSWIQRPFNFLGMIGSARKARTIFEHFIEEKIASTEQLQRVACPVGLKIGSASVMEIAVSIMAQFIQQRAALKKSTLD